MSFRYNDFTHDPLSACNCTPPYSAENAISARCDLNPINGTYPFGALGHRPHGGTDMKVRISYAFTKFVTKFLTVLQSKGKSDIAATLSFTVKL